MVWCGSTADVGLSADNSGEQSYIGLTNIIKNHTKLVNPHFTITIERTIVLRRIFFIFETNYQTYYKTKLCEHVFKQLTIHKLLKKGLAESLLLISYLVFHDTLNNTLTQI